jgi:hypothetical protein
MSDIPYENLPERLQPGMRRYVEDGGDVGNFLTAVLSNDLRNTLRHADATNLKLLTEIVGWLHWEVPDSCWGSVEAVKTWKKTRRGVRHVD